ncbi:MAG: hypothetical protein CSA21_03340 [Deltaproteobacteria bacterium]|nr:MAG: hypothetical protein CSA21_03340 [Deltaproteobacteria bacterium]
MKEVYLEQIIPILQLAIGPVIVISGVGLLLLSMTNRLGRVIDRSRNLVEDENKYLSNRHHVQEQLAIMMARAHKLRAAIACVSLCLFLDVILIITLFICALFHINGTVAIILLFIGSMISLTIGLLYFMLDINTSLSALTIEITADN